MQKVLTCCAKVLGFILRGASQRSDQSGLFFFLMAEPKAYRSSWAKD